MNQKKILLADEEKRLQWTIHLATSENIRKLKKPSVERLWKGYRKFAKLPPQPLRMTAEALYHPEVFRAHNDADTLLEIQKAGRNLLDAHAAGTECSVSIKGRMTITWLPGKWITDSIDGDAVDVFCVMLAQLLSVSDLGARVRKCPECGRLFLRIRRQLYCSDRCTDRATWRNYPESKKRRSRQPLYDLNGWKMGARKK